MEISKKKKKFTFIFTDGLEKSVPKDKAKYACRAREE